MKRFLVAGVMLAVALAVTACSGCAPLQALSAGMSNTEAIGGKTALDEKALFAVEAAFYGANVAAEAAVDNGLLKGPTATKVADALDVGHKALLTARAAYRAGDAKSFGARLTAAQDAIGEAWSLIPKPKT